MLLIIQGQSAGKVVEARALGVTGEKASKSKTTITSVTNETVREKFFTLRIPFEQL
jgi:hypothetical protein